ncbi:unnamed protein product, partial [Prorocentrum cordatum]
ELLREIGYQEGASQPWRRAPGAEKEYGRPEHGDTRLDPAIAAWPDGMRRPIPQVLTEGLPKKLPLPTSQLGSDVKKILHAGPLDGATGAKIVESMDRGNPRMRIRDEREEKPQ